MTQTLGFNGLTFPFLNTGTTTIQRYRAFQVGDGDSTSYASLLHGVKVLNAATITDSTLSSTGATGKYTQPPIAVAVNTILPGQIGIGLVKGLAICELGASESAVLQGEELILDQSDNSGTFEGGTLNIAGADPTSGLVGYAIADSLSYPILGGTSGAKQDFTDNTTPATTITVVFALVDFTKSLGLTEFQHTHS